MEFIVYQNEIRPIIQDKIQNHSEQLFNSNARFNAIIYHIFKKLKKYNQKVKNIKQIRASVITNWLRQYNLRKVQYLAGHRYISSTERYLQDDLENLHEIVNNPSDKLNNPHKTKPNFIVPQNPLHFCFVPLATTM